MSAGNDVTVQQIKNDVSSYAATAIRIFRDFGNYAASVQSFGLANIQAVYTASYGSDPGAPTKGGADAADYATFLQNFGAICMFATHGAPGGTVTPTDNTSGSEAVTVSVPAGSYAVVISDPATIGLAKFLGIDLSPSIRKLAPLNT